MHGKFPDPIDRATRLYGEVLSTRGGFHYVKVNRRNARTITPYNTIVPEAEFLLDSGANKGAWRKQLRGKDGKWIEMGGGIEWKDSKGKRQIGTVAGFDDEVERVIVKDTDGKTYKLTAKEIKQSAVKAVIPDKDKPEASEELDLDELLTSMDNEPVNPTQFFSDHEKFPIGGPPLEIKDKQGKLIARVTKEKGDDGQVSLLFGLLLSLLPHDLKKIFRNLGK